MINFAELKLKLTEPPDETYKSGQVAKPNDDFDITCYVSMNDYKKSAKIISELLDVIEMQNNKMSFLNKLVGACAYSQSDIWGDKMETVYRNTDKSLSETESKLKQLINGAK